MAEVRKHGTGRGGQIAAAVERAMAQGVRPSGAPPEPGPDGQDGPAAETPAPRNTQNLVTATSFWGSDPFLPPAPAKPVDDGEEDAAAGDDDAENEHGSGGPA